MAQEYDRTNTGTLGRNKRRQEGTRQPEYSGQLNIDGVEYWLNAWVKEGNGEKFFSISVKPKDAQQASRQGSPAHSGSDDIPFNRISDKLSMVI